MLVLTLTRPASVVSRQVYHVGYHHTLCEEKLARMAAAEARYQQILKDTQSAVIAVTDAEKLYVSQYPLLVS